MQTLKVENYTWVVQKEDFRVEENKIVIVSVR